MRYADTYLKNKRKNPFAVLKNRFRSGEDPDLRMERFLMAKGEFSAEASLAFDRQLERGRQMKLMGAM